jgi:DNA helicase HerA-like ATPase
MIFGKKREGKSNFVQYLLSLREHRNALIYDICREHGNVDTGIRYKPEYRFGEEARSEAGGITEKFVTENDRDRRPDLVVYEELSRIAPNGGGTDDAIMDLVDLARHYSVGIVGVARRPAQVETTITELADQIVVFYLDGDNDIKKLNSIKSGLGDRAEQLDKYHFLVNRGRDITEYGPVPEMDTTGKL